jgi:hypothetical protein
MKLQPAVFSLVFAFLSFGTQALAASTGNPVFDAADGAAKGACAAPVPAPGCVLQGQQRTHLSGDVYGYSYLVPVGPGAHDVIKLHRVVRESAPGVPVPSDKSVFMVHGDAWGFEGAFLSSTRTEAVSRDQSIAIFLAQGGVDVWGIDLRWVQVPPETTDFSFMKAWNLGTHVRDVRTGLTLARHVRRTEGREGQLNLFGWSRGAVIAYAYAGAESQLPAARRHVGGLIPVDIAAKFGPGDDVLRQRACGRYQQAQAALDGGQYEGGLLGPAPGLLIQAVGLYAATDPEGRTLHPQLTNRQLALLLTGATFSNGDALTPVPFYHLLGAHFDASGLPAGLTWTPERYAFDHLRQVATFQSFTEIVETEAIQCDGQDGAPDLPYDDHLGDIRVPVLFVGAAGGFGQQGLHTVSLLGSEDVTTQVVSFYPPEARVLDYGHSDLFLGANARAAVWTPILKWIQAH